MNKPLIIGVAGGTASGKTSVSRILYDAFSDRTITLLRQDDYYNCLLYTSPSPRD